MATRLKNKYDRAGEYRCFVLQKELVERSFPFFRCTLKKDILECVGEITPSEHCDTYKISIRYKKDGIPEVRILYPETRHRVHMYPNGTLCLYDHRDQPWNARDNLHKKLIPWIAEWLVFYELFLMCGEWRGPEAPHDGFEKKTEIPVIRGSKYG
jgi:hypothetical protein